MHVCAVCVPRVTRCVAAACWRGHCLLGLGLVMRRAIYFATKMEFIIGTRKEPAAGSSSTAAPTRESAHHAKPPKVLHGTGAEYHLLETLGRGSYAKVKRCTVPATGQVYAIKVFKKAVLKRQRVMSVEADSTVPEFMSKYDTNGDGILSEDEVAHIVADMHESRNSIHASPSAEPQRAPAQKRAAGPSEGPSASAKPATCPSKPHRSARRATPVPTICASRRLVSSAVPCSTRVALS